MKRLHSRCQRPRSFWSAPRIATSGKIQQRKSEIHGLPVTLRMLRKSARPEVAILGVDQKERGLWEREWPIKVYFLCILLLSCQSTNISKHVQSRVRLTQTNSVQLIRIFPLMNKVEGIYIAVPWFTHS